MSSEGATKLQYAIKTLRRHFDEMESHWKDSVRDDFEQKHLNPLANQVGATVRGMSTLGEVIQRICKDRASS